MTHVCKNIHMMFGVSHGILWLLIICRLSPVYSTEFHMINDFINLLVFIYLFYFIFIYFFTRPPPPPPPPEMERPSQTEQTKSTRAPLLDLVGAVKGNKVILPVGTPIGQFSEFTDGLADEFRWHHLHLLTTPRQVYQESGAGAAWAGGYKSFFMLSQLSVKFKCS